MSRLEPNHGVHFCQVLWPHVWPDLVTWDLKMKLERCLNIAQLCVSNMAGRLYQDRWLVPLCTRSLYSSARRKKSTCFRKINRNNKSFLLLSLKLPIFFNTVVSDIYTRTYSFLVILLLPNTFLGFKSLINHWHNLFCRSAFFWLLPWHFKYPG